MSGTLILVRHGQSEWNLKNLFTGWRDPGLSELGHEEAKAAGRKIRERGLRPDIAFTSVLSRAQVTNDHILNELGQADLETIRDQALAIGGAILPLLPADPDCWDCGGKDVSPEELASITRTRPNVA
jgi:broad specificity phosphatase PhoE